MEREANLTLEYVKAIQEAAMKAEKRVGRMMEWMAKYDVEKMNG